MSTEKFDETHLLCKASIFLRNLVPVSRAMCDELAHPVEHKVWLGGRLHAVAKIGEAPDTNTVHSRTRVLVSPDSLNEAEDVVHEGRNAIAYRERAEKVKG